MCILGRHSWIKLPFYVFFQVLGAFLAAATVGLQYYGEFSTAFTTITVTLSLGTGAFQPFEMIVYMHFVFLHLFADAIRAYSGGELTVTGPTATAGIFSTYPADYLSVWGGVVDQVRYCPSGLNIGML